MAMLKVQGSDATVILCKFCKCEQSNYRSLRIHCEIDHRREYVAIERWLGKSVQLRLKSFERLAEEGLIGYHEFRYE